MTVQANALSTTSNTAGGWSLSVDNGSYDVSCSGGAFAGSAAAADVVVADANRQVDCRSVVAQATVDFAPEPGPLGAAGAAIVASLAATAPRGRRARPGPRAR